MAQFARLSGWEVPNSKSPPPSEECKALEAQLDLQPFSSNPPLLRILKARKALQETLLEIRETSRLWPDPSERLAKTFASTGTTSARNNGWQQLLTGVFATRRLHVSSARIRPTTYCDSENVDNDTDLGVYHDLVEFDATRPIAYPAHSSESARERFVDPLYWQSSSCGGARQGRRL